MFQKTYIVLGNFVAAVNMMRRRDPVLDKWFEDSALRPYHVMITLCDNFFNFFRML